MSKRKSYSNEIKLKIFKALQGTNSETKMSQNQAAAHFGVSRGTVRNAIEIGPRLEEISESNQSLKKLRIRKESQVNILLWRWFCIARNQGYPISGPILKMKAIEIARSLGENEFSASEGWLESFKSRHNISTRVISGESANVNVEIEENWKANLASIMEGYEPENIFNMDETGYFFRELPNRSLAQKKAACKGGKMAKDRITVALTCSAVGEKLTPWVIGKSRKPRCLRGVNLDNVVYRSSPKAWMVNPIFNEYLLTLNQKMFNEGRKILLFVDNAPVHLIDGDTEAQLTNLKVIFFPPNLTSVVQPLDGGIIRSLKANIRKFSVLKLLSEIDSSVHASELVKKLNILDAIQFLVHSWELVSAETIKKCFKNCGFKISEEEGEDIDSVAAVVEEIMGLLEDARVDDLSVIIDEELDCYENVNEETLINLLVGEVQEEVEEEDEIDGEAIVDVEPNVSYKMVQESLIVLKKYSHLPLKSSL